MMMKSIIIVIIIAFSIGIYPDAFGQTDTWYLDKEIYQTGETVKITGNISWADGLSDIVLRVSNQNGNIVHIDQTSTDRYGDFYTEFVIGGTLNKSGMYTVSLNYNDVASAMNFEVIVSDNDNSRITPTDNPITTPTDNPITTPTDNPITTPTDNQNSNTYYSSIVSSQELNLYYNSEFSFSIEYPKGWNVFESENFYDKGVWISDGPEECTTFVGLDCLWNNSISVFNYSDLDKHPSDYEERQKQIGFERDICNQATYAIDGYVCSDFRIINELVPAVSFNGYPVITTVFSQLRDYPDDNASVQKTMIITSDIFVNGDMWEIVITSTDGFEKYESFFMNAINSFHIPRNPPSPIELEKYEIREEGGGCLIATATYGSELAPQVQQLRELRDNSLLSTESGTSFMSTFNEIYYSFSPYIADYERENPVFKEMVKLAITPMITSLSLMEYAESESEVLGIGISLIMLNVMMYVGIPVIAVMRFRR
jgi:hypothetical protein